MRGIFLFCFIFFSCNIFSSDIDVDALRAIGLPLVVIETDSGKDPDGYPVYPPGGAWGVGLAGNSYCTASMLVYLGDELLYNSGSYDSSSDTGVRIRLRGNTSAFGEKKPYKIKLGKKTDLLFRGVQGYEDKEWLLLNTWEDNIVKTVMGFKIGELLGLGWHPAYRFVNVVLNGDYKGIYILTESVKRASYRCDVAKSGYILEDDAYWWNEDVYFKGEILPYPVGYTFKYPDSDDIGTTDISLIKNYIIDFERALKSGVGYEEYIDVESFAAWLLAHDILGTSDSGGANRFLYKYDYNILTPTSTKLKMGILWDFNTCFRAEGWSTIHGKSYSFYYTWLLKYDSFVNIYASLWYKVKAALLDEISSTLDSIAQSEGEALDKSAEYELARWGYTTAETAVIHNKYKSLLSDRIEWISANIHSMSTRIDDIAAESGDFVNVYDLQGRLVLDTASFEMLKCLPKGMYMVNGKKYCVE